MTVPLHHPAVNNNIEKAVVHKLATDLIEEVHLRFLKYPQATKLAKQVVSYIITGWTTLMQLECNFWLDTHSWNSKPTTSAGTKP